MVCAVPAHALIIQTITGAFSDSIGGSNLSYPQHVVVPGFGTELENQARWGTAATPAGNSGLGFTPNGPSLLVLPETEFVIGRFRHFNNGVLKPAFTTKLSISLDIAAASPGLSTFPFTFLIDETDNIEPCVQPGVTICPDRIDNTNAQTGVTFASGGVNYTLSILGWRAVSPDGPFTNVFVSEEGGISTAYLVGKLTTVLTPEPGTALLLGAGLAGLAATRRRTPKT
jgi:hypothetical protein